jgi:hypothetical protein
MKQEIKKFVLKIFMIVQIVTHIIIHPQENAKIIGIKKFAHMKI